MIILNLLTSSDKKRVVKHHLILVLKDIVFSTMLIVAIVSVMLLISNYFLIDNFIQLSQGSVAISKTEESNREINKINNNLQEINSLQIENTDWAKVILSLNQLIVPNEIQLTNLEIMPAGEKQIIKLEGKALSRNGFLKFKQNLEDSPMLSNIESPLSNILLAKDINFTLAMYLVE